MNLSDNFQLYRNIIENNITEEELFLLKLQDIEVVDFALKMLKNKKEYPSLLLLPEDFLNYSEIYCMHGLLSGVYNLENDLEIISPKKGLYNGIEFSLYSNSKESSLQIVMNVYSAYFSNIEDVIKLKDKLKSKST